MVETIGRYLGDLGRVHRFVGLARSWNLIVCEKVSGKEKKAAGRKRCRKGVFTEGELASNAAREDSLDIDNYDAPHPCVRCSC